MAVHERPEEFCKNVEGMKKTPIRRLIAEASVCGQAILKLRDDECQYIYLDEHDKKIMIIEKEPLTPTLNDWYLAYRKRKHMKNKMVDPLDVVEIYGKHLDPNEGDYVLTGPGFSFDPNGEADDSELGQVSWPQVGVVKEVVHHEWTEEDSPYGAGSSISYELDIVTLKGELESTSISAGGILDLVHSADGRHKRKSKGLLSRLFGG